MAVIVADRRQRQATRSVVAEILDTTALLDDCAARPNTWTPLWPVGGPHPLPAHVEMTVNQTPGARLYRTPTHVLVEIAA